MNAFLFNIYRLVIDLSWLTFDHFSLSLLLLPGVNRPFDVIECERTLIVQGGAVSVIGITKWH